MTQEKMIEILQAKVRSLCADIEERDRELDAAKIKPIRRRA